MRDLNGNFSGRREGISMVVEVGNMGIVVMRTCWRHHSNQFEIIKISS